MLKVDIFKRGENMFVIKVIIVVKEVVNMVLVVCW